MGGGRREGEEEEEKRGDEKKRRGRKKKKEVAKTTLLLLHLLEAIFFVFDSPKLRSSPKYDVMTGRGRVSKMIDFVIRNISKALGKIAL